MHRVTRLPGTHPIPIVLLSFAAAVSAAGYVLLLGEMLVRQAGSELRLCACVPGAWLGKPLVVSRSATAFGPVSYRAALAGDGTFVVEASVPTRRPPRAVVVHMPVGGFRIRAARADVGQAKVDAPNVRVVGWKGKGKLEIQLVNTKPR